MSNTKTPPNIQRAGGAAALSDDQLRARLVHAPAWARASIDRERVERGMTPLFTVRAAVSASRLPAPPVAPAKPKVVNTLTILCAPGVSDPTDVRNNQQPLPEVITLSAWRSVMEAIEGGRHIPIQCGHGDAAHVLARSDSPRCRFMLSSAVGLVAQVDLLDVDAARLPDGCSIAIRCLKFVEERRGGRVIRFVTDAVIDHIAVFERGRLSEPVYPLARVVRSTKGYARRAGLDAMTKCIGQIQKASPWLLAR
jgi:hypothetical protein